LGVLGDEALKPENIPLFKAIAEGSKEALAKVKAMILEAELAVLGLTNKNTEKLENFLTKTFEIGVSLEETGYRRSFDKLIETGEITAQKLADILTVDGWSIIFDNYGQIDWR
jgi:hypothetical protein